MPMKYLLRNFWPDNSEICGQKDGHDFASFEAFTAVTFQVEVVWVVTPCSVVVGYHRFRGPRCLYLYPQHYMASQPRSHVISSLMGEVNSVSRHRLKME
jgi:hypothetical protein